MPKKQTVDIHGKEYETVASRLARFWEKYPDYSVTTQLKENTEEFVTFRATILDSEGRVRATGHAREKYGAGHINETSALENCETSAIGRCLASFNFMGSEFASAEEVANALTQRKPRNPTGLPATHKQKKFIETLYTKDMDGDRDMLRDYIEQEGYNPDTLTTKEASDLIAKMQKEIG